MSPHSKDAYAAEQMASYLGEAFMDVLALSNVTELYTNASGGQVWVDRHGSGRELTDVELDPNRVRLFLNLVANRQHETLDPSNEHIQAQLPVHLFGGARLQGLLPRVVDSPCFNIRKRTSALIPLASYVEDEIMSAEQKARICAAVEQRKNILVAGGTGSGKTTLVGAIIDQMVRTAPGDRYVILEDTPELHCRARDCQQLRTTIHLELSDLVKLTLRIAPTRIIVGEVRDGSALHLMDAWVTGHPGGVGTVHATTPAGALRRMARLARRAAPGEHAQLAAEAIDLVLLIEGHTRGRRLREIVAVEDRLAPDGEFILHSQARHPTVFATGPESTGRGPEATGGAEVLVQNGHVPAASTRSDPAAPTP